MPFSWFTQPYSTVVMSFALSIAVQQTIEIKVRQFDRTDKSLLFGAFDSSEDVFYVTPMMN